MAVNEEYVSFSKDSTSNFNSQTDNDVGKIYFRKDGIFVNGFQYSITPDSLISSYSTEGVTIPADWSGGYVTLTDSTTSGTYLIQVICDNNYYSGIFSYTGSTNRINEEILLHASGTGKSRIYMKNVENKLYIASDTILEDVTFTIKIKKLI